MKLIKIIRILIVLLMCNQMLMAQNITLPNVKLNWQNALTVNTPGGFKQQYLKFDDAIMSGGSIDFLPHYFFKIEVSGLNKYEALLGNMIFDNAEDVYPKNLISNDFNVKVNVAEERGKYFALIDFVPLKRDANGILQKLTDFQIQLNIVGKNSNYKALQNGGKKIVSHSVLASGNWFQFYTQADGVYKIDATLLQQMGINTSTVDPQNIRIYSMGAGNISELNKASFMDDLSEISIEVVGEADHHFDANDYILFYGEHADKIIYNNSTKQFTHQKNLYSDKTFYFITADLGIGKRLSNSPNVSGSNNIVSEFDDYQYIDNDGINLAHTGRVWYDANDFDNTLSRNYNFNFANLITNQPIKFNIDAAAQSVISTNMDVYFNGNTLTNLGFGPYTPGYDRPVGTTQSFVSNVNSSSDAINIQLNYNKNSNVAGICWLNYISLLARRSLIMNGNQMIFKDSKSVGTGKISTFNISNSTSNSIWDITDKLNPSKQLNSQSGNQQTFTISTDTLHQFIAFNNNGFLTPTISGAISNSDIHGQIQASPELIIVSHSDFLSAASTLANFHINTLHQKTLLVSTNQVYNEFGGGKPDIGAIRNMMRTFYDAAGNDTSKMPKYLLLMGDGSYDNRNIISANTAYIPTYESQNSIDKAASFTSDDFFGCLSVGEGESLENGTHLLDISVGRIPCKTITEANQVVSKILNYKSAASFGNWVNNITFIADDEDRNTHINDADKFASNVTTLHPEINVDKIYFDAYKQVESSSGSRYPEVHDAIIRKIESGSLVMNYTGHGGEGGWAHERIFETPDINLLENYNKLSLFVTATCEFSRYDIPEMVTGGEALILNPKGGAIALFTTVRLVYTGGNEDINRNIYNYFFKKNNDGSPIAIGEVFRLAKNATGQDENNRKFTLLGDPAITLNFPDFKIRNEKINQKIINNDTLKAFGKYTIVGNVTDKQNNILSNFNGIVYPTIFDKSQTVTTLANDPYPEYSGGSIVRNYSLQKNTIYKGKASVKNGLFTYTFIVPKDISYHVGKGKFSYYANDPSNSANGYDGSINVGSFADSTIKDKQGPIIKLYMNDFKFANGGITDENPTLIVKLQDISGINTAGIGIGHDITATLDNDTKNTQSLNDFYETDLDSYQKGSLRYPFKNLSVGQHTLMLKAWDVYNNPNTAELEFTVAENNQVSLSHVLNYPNPFTTHTTFFFEHNMPGQALDVMINIYTISGKNIKTIRQQVQTSGYRSDSIDWDGLDEFGDKIGRGVYFYKLTVKNNSGITHTKMQKLVVL
ncbi:MAG: type secretion system sortase PorU [Bacteroidota bacterium]